MRKEIIFLVPGCSAGMKLWFHRTLVRSQRYTAILNAKITKHHNEHNVVSFVVSPGSLCSKRTFTFVFFICLLVKTTTAQSLIDTTYRTSYYDQKVSQFRLLPDTKGEIIFLGNSITDLGEWAEIWQNNHVKNRGISSDNTFGVLARLDEVVASRPAKIFILIGINDISKNTPDSVVVSKYKKIIQRIQMASPKTLIYVQSILPTNNEFIEFTRHQNKEGHILTVNAALKKMCTSKRLLYADLYAAFIDAEGKLDKRYTNDGLHLMGAGFTQWKKILLEKGYMK